MSGAFASEPGQPLDCSEWVSLFPGFTCTELERIRDSSWVGGGIGPVYDNGGNLYRLTYATSVTTCGGLKHNRLALVRDNGFREEVFAFIEPRCVSESPPTWDLILVLAGLSFDPISGRLLLRLTSQPSDGTLYPPRNWVAAIDGFTTLFDVLQTYSPQQSISFRVPYMPEGLPAADYFDTYYGALTNPIDFTGAQPLQCAGVFAIDEFAIT